MLLFALFLTLPSSIFPVSVRQTFNNIDTNEDRAISASELTAWFNYQDIEYLKGNAKEHFTMFDKNRDEKVSWAEYAPISFGMTLREVYEDVYNGMRPTEFLDSAEHIQEAILTAVRRWKAAGGFSMSRDEFTGFAYPELYQHMRRVVVAEARDKYDTDNDGKVSTHELLVNKFEMSKDEVEQFSKGTLDLKDRPNLLGLRDNNDDGIFDKKELGNWVMENRRLMRKKESDNLFSEMDFDKNTRISITEFEASSHVIKKSSAGRYIREEL